MNIPSILRTLPPFAVAACAALALLIPTTLFIACNDCPNCVYCDSLQVLNPIIRDVTITEYDPVWINDAPGPKYSIQMYQLPSSYSSAGSYKTFTSLLEGRGVTLDSVTSIPGTTYKAYLVSRKPWNRIMSDSTVDIMVSEVDIAANPARAWLRFSGSLHRDAEVLNDASTTAFYDFMNRKRPTYLDTYALLLDAYGQGMARMATHTTITVFIDSTTGLRVFPSPAPSVSFTRTLPEIFEVPVQAGDMFCYQAVNGILFFVHVEDIRQSPLTPNFNRVTLKISEVRNTRTVRYPC